MVEKKASEKKASSVPRYAEGHPLYKPPSEQTAQYPVEKPGEPIPQEILQGQARYLEQPEPEPDLKEPALEPPASPKKPSTAVSRRRDE